MDYMFEAGFLGTRAPFFMDMVTLIVAILPLLIAVAIFFAKMEKYTLHALVQIVIFVVSVIVVGYFEYGVRLGGGYNTFVEGTNVSHVYALWVLIVHIVIASVTLLVWTAMFWLAYNDRKRYILPGMNSSFHKKMGMWTFVGIVLTSLTGIWVYLLLFVY